MTATTLRLRYRPPFDWPAMLAFYRLRAVYGLECVTDKTYVRSVRIDGSPAVIAVSDDPAGAELVVLADGIAPPAIPATAARLRAMFDLDADIAGIGAHLSRDPFLAPLVAARPAMRVPAHWEPFETALRAILGQQVTLAAAARLNARLVERAGTAFAAPSDDQPFRLFPTPGEVLAADFSSMGMPGARIKALLAMAEAFLADPELFTRAASIEQTVARLLGIKGIGPWTAHYIAVRACREPDAFPASDVGLLRGTADAAGRRPSPDELTRRAEAWRPFRAYAAHHIWAADEHKIIRQR